MVSWKAIIISKKRKKGMKMKKTGKIIAIAILVAMLLAAVPAHAADGKTAEFGTLESEIVALFNKARENLGMDALEHDETLAKLARMKAEEMAASLSESPEFPNGLKQFLKDSSAESKARNQYSAAGKKTAAEAVEIWKKQIGFDRDTWAREKTTNIGVGAAKGSDGRMYYVCIATKPFGDKEKAALEDEAIRLINEERKKQGLPPATKNDDLAKVARMKAQDMADNGYCAHESPTYGSPANMAKSHAPDIKYAGENIAAGQQTASDAFRAWMDSPKHKAIMLKKSADCIGIGVALDSKGNLIWSLFMGTK